MGVYRVRNYVDEATAERMEGEIDNVRVEVLVACKKHKKFASAHEGYAILLEEVDELWAEVKKKPAVRSTDTMRTEAIHVAAMALRFLHDLC